MSVKKITIAIHISTIVFIIGFLFPRDSFAGYGSKPLYYALSNLAGRYINGVMISKHAAKRMVERSISISDILRAFTHGRKYYDINHGGYCYFNTDSKNQPYYIALDNNKKRIKTVVRGPSKKEWQIVSNDDDK